VIFTATGIALKSLSRGTELGSRSAIETRLTVPAKLREISVTPTVPYLDLSFHVLVRGGGSGGKERKSTRTWQTGLCSA